MEASLFSQQEPPASALSAAAVWGILFLDYFAGCGRGFEEVGGQGSWH